MLCIYIYIYIYLYLSLSLYIYIYIYIHNFYSAAPDLVLGKWIWCSEKLRIWYPDLVIWFIFQSFFSSGGVFFDSNNNKHDDSNTNHNTTNNTNANTNNNIYIYIYIRRQGRPALGAAGRRITALARGREARPRRRRRRGARSEQ